MDWLHPWIGLGWIGWDDSLLSTAD